MFPTYAHFNPVSVNEQVWYLDSTVASHMAPDDGKLVSKSIYFGNIMVKVSDGTLLAVAHIGTSVLPTKHKPRTLTNILHVPKLQHNLLSMRQLCHDNNCHVMLDSFCVCVKDNTVGDVMLQASSLGPVYTILDPVSAVTIPANVVLTECGNLWHWHLGHCGVITLDVLKKNGLVQFTSAFSNTCVSYRLAKSQRLPFIIVEHSTYALLQLIHSDV